MLIKTSKWLRSFYGTVFFLLNSKWGRKRTKDIRGIIFHFNQQNVDFVTSSADYFDEQLFNNISLLLELSRKKKKVVAQQLSQLHTADNFRP